MAMEFYARCEGCDKKQQLESAEPSRVTNGWEHTSINVGDWGKVVHLCELCAKKLREQADPLNWPRAEKEHIGRKR